MRQTIRAGRHVVVPLYAADAIGLDVQAIGWIITVSALVDMSLFYPAGHIMDRYGRKFAMVPCFLTQAIAMAAIPFTHSFTGLLLATSLLGLGNGIGAGTMMTLGADLAPGDSIGEFLGAWRLVGETGHTGAPLVVRRYRRSGRPFTRNFRNCRIRPARRRHLCVSGTGNPYGSSASRRPHARFRETMTFQEKNPRPRGHRFRCALITFAVNARIPAKGNRFYGSRGTDAATRATPTEISSSRNASRHRPREAASGLNQLTTLLPSVSFPQVHTVDCLFEREADPMTRESLIAGICLLITLGVMWFADHPDKVAGSVILGIVFCVFILVARLKGRSGSGRSRMIRKTQERK